MHEGIISADKLLYPGFGGLFCEGTQQTQIIGQQSHGIVEPGQWAYFTLNLDHKDPTWQGGLAVAFLTTNGGHPVVLQKYGGVPTLQDCDNVLRYGSKSTYKCTQLKLLA